MNEIATTRVRLDAGQKIAQGRTDWKHLRDLSDAEVTAAALADPDVQPMAEDELARMRRVLG